MVNVVVVIYSRASCLVSHIAVLVKRAVCCLTEQRGHIECVFDCVRYGCKCVCICVRACVTVRCTVCALQVNERDEMNMNESGRP